MKALGCALALVLMASAAWAGPRHVSSLTVGEFVAFSQDGQMGYLAGFAAAVDEFVVCPTMFSVREDLAAVITRYNSGRLAAGDAMTKAWWALHYERGCQVKGVTR